MESVSNLDPGVAILQRVYLRRCENNPRYSLRAFAKSLGLSHSFVSMLLSQKRRPSTKTVNEISKQLGLDPVEKEILLTEARKESMPSTDERSDKFVITLDTFALMSTWYHYAILNLLRIPTTQFRSSWIAKRLGISKIEAKLALERLIRMKMVKRVGKKWIRAAEPIHLENEISTNATKKFHKQLLEKAILSLENDPFEKREVSSMTLAMDPHLIPYSRRRIKQFLRELSDELESMGKPKEVYNLTTQIYPVTKEEVSG